MDQFFTVFSRGMTAGFSAVAAFSVREAADQFKQERGLSIVRQEMVQGRYTAGGTLYAAHRYLAHADEYDFLGLFADYDDAERAGGCRGMVMLMNPA